MRRVIPTFLSFSDSRPPPMTTDTSTVGRRWSSRTIRGMPLERAIFSAEAVRAGPGDAWAFSAAPAGERIARVRSSGRR